MSRPPKTQGVMFFVKSMMLSKIRSAIDTLPIHLIPGAWRVDGGVTSTQFYGRFHGCHSRGMGRPGPYRGNSLIRN